MKPTGNDFRNALSERAHQGLTVLGLALLAGTVSAELPHEFSANEAAVAAEVNENFEYLDNRLNDGEAALRLRTQQIDCDADPNALRDAIASGSGKFEITAGPCNGNVTGIQEGMYEIAASSGTSATINGSLNFNGGYAKLDNLTLSGSNGTGSAMALLTGYLGTLIETNGLTLACDGVDRAVYLYAAYLSFGSSNASGCADRTMKITNGSNLYLWGDVTVENGTDNDGELLWARRSSTIEIFAGRDNRTVRVTNNSGNERARALQVSQGSSLMVHSSSGLELTGMISAYDESAIEISHFTWHAINGVRAAEATSSTFKFYETEFSNVEVEGRFNSMVDVTGGKLTDSTINLEVGSVARIKGYGDDGATVELDGGASNNTYTYDGDPLVEAPMEFFDFICAAEVCP